MKAWTGGDAIEATPKYGHPLKFYADGTIFLVGNELPEIEFKDDAMWERVLVVPFTVTIPEGEQIKGLKDQFDPRAILAWLVEGHREYREKGLAPPPAACLAKEAHRLAADPLAEFWDDCTVRDPGSRVSKQELFARYDRWALRCGIKQADRLTQTALTRAANKRAELTGDFRKAKSGPWEGWRGLRLIDSDASAEESALD